MELLQFTKRLSPLQKNSISEFLIKELARRKSKQFLNAIIKNLVSKWAISFLTFGPINYLIILLFQKGIYYAAKETKTGVELLMIEFEVDNDDKSLRDVINKINKIQQTQEVNEPLLNKLMQEYDRALLELVDESKYIT